MVAEGAIHCRQAVEALLSASALSRGRPRFYWRPVIAASLAFQLLRRRVPSFCIRFSLGAICRLSP